ncbi:MAG TPA: hypothetical protein VK154_01340 [Chitinophagales bacterium]|nr:hypothetical protein [Chitinophagales bacterium]
MISITTHEQKLELRLKFSTGWIKQAMHFISWLLSFSEIRAIEQRKQTELHEAGLDFLKMI